MNLKALKRKVIATFIVMMFALFATIGSTYAYWNMLTHTENPIVLIGEGDTIIVSVSTAGSGQLIPVGETPTTGEVTSIIYEYEVAINTAALNANETTLTVEAQNVLIGGNSTYSDLVNIDISGITILSTTAITVTVTITLTEPADQTSYNAIINQNITFDLVFTASV